MSDASLDIAIKGNATSFGRVAAETTRQINGIKEAVKAIPANAIASLGSSLVAFASVDFISRQIAGVVEYSGKIADLSERVGATTDFLQAADYAAQQFGARLEDVVVSLRELQRSSANALANPKSPDANAFRGLGISKEQLGAPVEELFRSVADAMEQSALSGARLNDAMTVLGKTAASIIPMMRGGFRQTEEEAKRLGLVINSEQIAKLDEAGDKWSRLLLQAKVALAPIVSWLLDIGDALMKVQELTIAVGKAFFDITTSTKNNNSWGKFFSNMAAPVKELTAKWATESKASTQRRRGDAVTQTTRTAAKDITVPLGPSNADAMQRLGLFIGGSSGPMKIAADHLRVSERALAIQQENLREIRTRL